MQSAVKLLRTLGLYGAAKRIKDFVVTRTPSHHQHRMSMRAFYAAFVRQGGLCFDIGANVGNRTGIFLGLGARVVAVEPQTACVEALKHTFAGNHNVAIVNAALGIKEGTAEIQISEATTISSLSDKWIDRVKESGRFAAYEWNKSETVRVTTFDALIKQYGVPDFCKIDVEGYEYEVLQGLTQPVGALSFEFTPEYLEPAVLSIKRLATLDEPVFNYSIGESMTLSLDCWVDDSAIVEILESLPDKTVFGDVYALWRRG